MAYTIAAALDDPDITLIDQNDAMGEYVFSIGELETPVVVTLRRLPHDEPFEFHTSHSIKTPEQMSPYNTSKPFETDYAHALHRAVRGLTEYYREGVDAGHEPNESWLVKG